MEGSAVSVEVERVRFATAESKPDVLSTLGHRRPWLGRGEVETLALVVSKKAQVTILDGRIARPVARLEGLRVVGTFGLAAKTYGGRRVSKPEPARLLERLTAAEL